LLPLNLWQNTTADRSGNEGGRTPSHDPQTSHAASRRPARASALPGPVLASRVVASKSRGSTCLLFGAASCSLSCGLGGRWRPLPDIGIPQAGDRLNRRSLLGTHTPDCSEPACPTLHRVPMIWP